MNNTSFEYHYFIKDHLGNVRLVLSETSDNNPVVVQASGYYPFGMLFQNEQVQAAQGTDANQYLYNGKEIQKMPGGWYDYGKRFYDAQLGRFTGVDPLANKFVWVSPYNYAENSPISNVDFWGLQKVFFQKVLKNDKNYQKVFDINKQTSGHKRFDVALKNQSKYNVFYYSFEEPTQVSGKHNAFDNMQDYKDYNRFPRGYFDHVNDSEIGAAFENDKKGVIFIGLNKVNNYDTKDKDKKADKALTLNHEEIAHGLEVLLNGEQTKSNEEGHKFYYGIEATTSPSIKKVLEDEKYKGSIAKEQLMEIYKIIENNENKK